MKMNLVLAGAALASLISLSTRAEAQDLEAVKKEVMKRIDITPAKLESPALKKVCSATFFSVKIKSPGSGGFMHTDLLLATHQGKFIDLESKSTSQPMPTFLSVINKGFRMKTEADAKTFEEALDKLYPIRSFGDDKKVKAMNKTATGWNFIRGTFFKDLSGFVITIDSTGRIKSIDYKLKINK